MIWTEEDSRHAQAEGWDICTMDGSDPERWQLQSMADDGTFVSDAQVWEHVWRLANQNPDGLHNRALTFMVINDPGEYYKISRHNGGIK